ncbi:MAG: hypothetical protein KF708_23130 [Pirellulales bacterium]|nr:hypothetical protein [Pirellulales bacterium]
MSSHHPSRAALLDVQSEARAFHRLRARLVTNGLRQTLAASRLRVTLVIFLTAIFWLALFVLFFDSFIFLRSTMTHTATHDQTVRAIFSIFFASLMVMLIFSSAIILYGGLYRTREVRFLLTTPARSERIFLHKFQEAMLFSSWGFVLLGSPMLLAYGLAAVAPWYYFVLAIPFLVTFIYIPGSIGAILCMVIVRWLPRRWRQVLIAAGLAAVVLTLWVAWNNWRAPEARLMTPDWFQDVISRLSFSEHRLLPSWWLATGLLTGAAHDPAEAMMFLAVTLSNALVLHQLAVWASGYLLRPGYWLVEGQGSSRTRAAALWLDRIFGWGLFFLPRTMRTLIVKDLRLFRRDPVQWSQFLIFFGLLGLYFLNIRRLSYDINHKTWVNMVSFLNVAVVGLILSTFTSRFIFPMISLEGRRFWILGRLPIDRDTILWSKFLFASIGAIIPCATLVLLSDLMLRVEPLILAIHQATCLLLCLGLSGIAVGLGARMPNLREESPTKIAAGFGGTLNLVLSAIYIVAVVLLTAVPCHFYLATQDGDPQGMVFDPERLRWWIGMGAMASLLLGIAATTIPLSIGMRAFRRLEF